MREWGTLKICSLGCKDHSRSRRVRMLATRADTDTAIQTCVFTVCADVPKKRVLRRGCVIHGKKFDRPAQTRPLAHRRCGPRHRERLRRHRAGSRGWEENTVNSTS